MSFQATLLFLLWAGPCLAATATKPGEATACVDSTAVKGHTAAIRCNLGRNVRQSKHNIDVKFYPGDSNEPVPVLKCNWLVKRPEEPTCTAYRGCHYNSSFGDILDIEFTNVTKDNEGRYICQLVPSDGVPALPCRLTVTDESASTASPVDDSNSTVTPSPQTPEESTTQVNIAAIVLGVITVVLVMGNLVLVVAYWRLRRKRQLEAVQNEQGGSESSSASSASDAFLKTQEPSESCVL